MTVIQARAALGLTGQQQQLNGSTSPAQEAAEQATKEAAAVKDNAGAVAAAEAVAGNQQQELDAVDAAVEQPASKKQKKDKNKQESRKKEKKAKSSKGDEAEAAAAGGSMPQPVAAAEDQEPSSTANNEADGNKQQKKKKKDKSNDKSRGKEQVEQQELDFAPLLAVAQKKLKKKGKLGLKKLEALLKDNANGGFTQDVIKAVKEQVGRFRHNLLTSAVKAVWVCLRSCHVRQCCLGHRLQNSTRRNCYPCVLGGVSQLISMQYSEAVAMV